MANSSVLPAITWQCLSEEWCKLSDKITSLYTWQKYNIEQKQAVAPVHVIKP